MDLGRHVACGEADVNSFSYGALLGLLAGVGFTLSKGIVNDVMESRPIALTMIHSGHDLVGLAVAGGIIGAWP